METAIENQNSNDMTTKLDEEKLKSLLNEDKKNLFDMDTINAANVGLGWNEERLAVEINCGTFPQYIACRLAENTVELHNARNEVEKLQSVIEKLRAQEEEMTDLLLAPEAERIEYLCYHSTPYCIIRSKLARGLKLTAFELKYFREQLTFSTAGELPFDQIETQGNLRD